MGDVTAQAQPLRGDQAEAQHHDAERDHPPDLGPVDLRQERVLHQGRGARQHRDTETPDEDQHTAEKSAYEHTRRLGIPGDTLVNDG